MPEIIHWTVVFGADIHIGNVDAEKNFDVIFKVPLYTRPSTPKLRINVSRSLKVIETGLFGVTGILRKS